jgi:hypothetical protein
MTASTLTSTPAPAGVGFVYLVHLLSPLGDLRPEATRSR